ncbi:rft2 [Symbiodinium natans]|uniref:Rft2 protein n=1 Tax=Symbiodinium natans TaxID=878477 RepID=A0A812T2Q5_9DINO|nr:rft2 [Symbiodinium natans]
MLPAFGSSRSHSGGDNVASLQSPESRLLRAISGESHPDAEEATCTEISAWYLTGMSGWWSLNIITAELPFFVAELPEGKRLGNLIAVCTQVGNIAPIFYKALTRRRPGNLVCAIGFFQVVGVVALAACSVLWRTTPILLLCTVLAGSVGCMSSVTYWAAVAQRPASCVRGMSVGMTLGGLLATGFAAMQLAGCEQGSPRFSPAVFFILAAVIQAGQGGAFTARSCGQTGGQNGQAANGQGAVNGAENCETTKPPMPRIAKFLMAGCFIVYATTYTMPTLMPFMAGHFGSATASQQLLLWMQVLQNSGDVLGRLATALVQGNRIVLLTWMLLLTASFSVCLLTSVYDASLWFSYSFAVFLLPVTCGLFYFSRGLLVTTMYLYARGLGQQQMVQEITENMGFCGQMGALIANFAAFVLVSLWA